MIPVLYRGPCANARYARLDGAGAADKGLTCGGGRSPAMKREADEDWGKVH